MDGSWISSFFNSFGIYNKCSIAHRRDFHRAKVAVGICFEPTINRNEFRGANVQLNVDPPRNNNPAQRLIITQKGNKNNKDAKDRVDIVGKNENGKNVFVRVKSMVGSVFFSLILNLRYNKKRSISISRTSFEALFLIIKGRGGVRFFFSHPQLVVQ